jgi:uncharacterized damage-inducible protein DinB
VADQKPPRGRDDERTTLLSLLRYQRESLIRKVEGASAEVVRSSPVGSGTSLLWLVKHLTRAEALWVLDRFAGTGEAAPAETVAHDDTVAGAVAGYRAMSARVDEVISETPLDRVGRSDGDAADVNLRWVLAHLLEETARHAGHADILRELADGSTGR